MWPKLDFRVFLPWKSWILSILQSGFSWSQQFPNGSCVVSRFPNQKTLILIFATKKRHGRIPRLPKGSPDGGSEPTTAVWTFPKSIVFERRS